MIKQPTWLLDYKKDIYSQTGEDGIIEKMVQVLPQSDKWCVEFGAWDGLFLSNTRNLIVNLGYSAVLIEGNKAKFHQLRKNYSNSKNIITLNAFVGWRKDDSLDAILANYPVPYNFDFLSIDIDGNDYHVWKAISKYHPKLVCIEFNPTIPTGVRFIQPAEPSVSQGASLCSLVELGKEKGYELISVLPFNAFFIDSQYYPLFEIDDNRPEILRTNLDTITYLFSGYDGTIFLHGNKKLPWHDIALKESQMQRLPKFLRKYPDNYNPIEKIAFALYFLLSSPGEFFRKMVNRLTKR